MKLSEEEVALAEQYISQFESVTRMWRWARWILLSIAITMLGLVVYLYVNGVEVKEMNSAENLLKGVALTEENVAEYINARIGLLRAEGTFGLMMIFPTLFGGAALGFATAGWGQERRRKLIAKSLRILLSKNDS